MTSPDRHTDLADDKQPDKASTGADPSEPLSVDVFISYRRADASMATRIAERLHDRGVRPWYDALIPPGADWRDTIADRLGQARIMIVLLSEAALQSDELKKELAVADQADVPLLAVRLEEVLPRQAFAYELARSNWFDVFDDTDRRLDELADFLASLTEDPDAMTTALASSVKARRSQRRRSRAARVWGWTRSWSVLAAAFLVTSALAFLFYESASGAIGNLVAGGLSRLTALAYVLLVVTLGSPLLFVSIIGAAPGLTDLPLLLLSGLNTALLLLMARHAILGLAAAIARKSSG